MLLFMLQKQAIKLLKTLDNFKKVINLAYK